MSDERNQKIDYIEFPAADTARAKAFYSDVFGWKFEDYGPTYTSFADGRIAGGFQADAAAHPAKPLIVIYATDLEAAQAAVERAGAPGHMEKRGIFSTPKAAWELVQKSGWSAQPDVQQLEADPT